MSNIKHGMKGSKTYSSWCNMKTRCNNPNYEKASSYSGRGIVICDRWSKFESFLADMGECPEGFTLDRIDNNKGYSPDNCRWADATIQARNQRTYKNNKTGFKGVSYRCSRDRYTAVISVNKKRINLGHFKTLEDAVKARKDAELKYW